MYSVIIIIIIMPPGENPIAVNKYYYYYYSYPNLGLSFLLSKAQRSIFYKYT